LHAADHVGEVVIVDPEKRSVDWLTLVGGEYRVLECSGLIELGPDELATLIDWP
jgi:hypothetical protein